MGTTLKDTQDVENDAKDIQVTEISTVTEMNDNTDIPDFSVDNPQEEIDEDFQLTQDTATISPEKKPEENEVSETVNDSTTTSIIDNETTTYSQKEEEDHDEAIVTEKNVLQEAETEKKELTDKNNEDDENESDLDITKSETTTQSAYKTETEKTIESGTEGKEMDDVVTDRGTEYETTTTIDEDNDEAQVSPANSVTETTLPNDIL